MLKIGEIIKNRLKTLKKELKFWNNLPNLASALIKLITGIF